MGRGCLCQAGCRLNSLINRAKHALAWNAVFNIFRDFLGLIVMLVLVRLLEPDQYGEFALVTAIIGFVSVFAHQNFIAHSLQVRNDDDVRYQDHFTAGGPIQIAMFVIANIIAVGLSFSDSYANASPLVHVMSIGFLLEWPCELRLKMLERSLDWSRLRLLHAIGLICSSALAIAMGFLGAGVYALLVPGLLVTLPFTFDLFFLQKWRPTWTWSFERYKPAMKFGLKRMTSGLVSRSRRLIESGVVVYVLGFSSAGLLERAVSLGLMFCQRVIMQIMYTLYPVMTKLEPGTDEYRRASGIIVRGVTWFAVPVAVVVVLLAAPLVHVVYGGKWDDVIPLVPAAAILGGVGAIFHVVYMLLLGHNEERRCMIADILELIGTLIALSLLLQEGLVAYLCGLLVVRLLVLIFSISWLLSCHGIDRKELSKALVPAVAASGLAYAVCHSVVSMVGLSIQEPVIAIGYGILFIITYMLSVRLFFTDVLVELLNYLPGSRAIGRVLFVGQNPS